MRRGDMLNACIALANEALLVTRNIKDYARVKGLRLDNWAMCLNDFSSPSRSDHLLSGKQATHPNPHLKSTIPSAARNRIAPLAHFITLWGASSWSVGRRRRNCR